MSQTQSKDQLAFDLIDRLHKSMRVSGHSTRTLGAALGTHRNTIANYLAGRITPNRRTLVAWALAVGHGVTAEWLETGQGDPLSPPTGTPRDDGDAALARLAAKNRARHAGGGATRRYQPVAA
jgi:transcriptional regulator with XRE-family HTH domain